MARKSVPPGAIIKTETTVSLSTTQWPFRFSLAAIGEFSDAVREQIGEGADELGIVVVNDASLTYVTDRTIKENIK